MATHVITTNHISLYGHPSPANSSTTTANTANTVNTANIANTSPNHTTNNSPTSPHLTTANLHQLPLQSRQLRPPKAPLYVPAALRPTERPQKHSPPTPPRSVHGSLDCLNDSLEVSTQAQAPISRRSTMESTFSASNGVSKLAEDEWMKNEHLGSVTGLPTKDHWKADRASSNCDSPTCRSSFGLFLRRHHCRHCGHVFCSSHTPHLVPLDQDARFHPDGVPSRACDLCWLAFNRWEETRGERLTKIQNVIDSQNSSGSDASNDSDGSEVSQDEAPKAALTPPTAQSGEIAASVPRGWNWSTF